jgi:predicted molibdopterin-dependent oxidoreductase YjgC
VAGNDVRAIRVAVHTERESEGAPEAAANELTHAALDPVAKIPEYKVCAVALEVATP